jgi:putative spermidine/putrescine transport system permease protein
VLALSMSSFVTPTLVGGVRLPVLAGAIYQQVNGTHDWNFAAAQAALLLLLALAVIVPYARFARARGEA